MTVSPFDALRGRTALPFDLRGRRDVPVAAAADAGVQTDGEPGRVTYSAFGWNPRRALIFSLVLAAALLGLNALAATSSLDAVPAVVRSVAVLAGMFLLPGIPLVVALRIPGRALAASMTLSLSVAVNILVTQATIVSEHWNPIGTQTALLATSAALSIAVWFTVPSQLRVGTIDAGRATWTRRRAGLLSALGVSTALLVLSARRIDVLDSGVFGVIAQVGPLYIAGLVCLAAVLVSALRATVLDRVVLSASVVVAIAFNTMIAGIATGETSIPTAFVHSGFIDLIAASGRLPDNIDARFSWAGFFTAGAHLQTVSGVDDVQPLLVWAPLVFGVLLAFGLYAVAIALTGRARIAWIAVLLYQAFNWYQQDYFAPQAVAMIFYTTLIATLLWMLRVAPLPRLSGPFWRQSLAALARTPGRVPGFGPLRTLAVGAALLVIITANTVAHQITPILAIIALGCFAMTGTTRYRTMWIAAGLIFAAWFSYGATDYWLGHLGMLFDEFGALGDSVDRGVGQRLSGDPLYQRMQYLRMASSAGFVLLGVAGWFVARRLGKRALWPAGMLCAAPAVLAGMQTYGGEMILRAFLFMSPVVAAFAALALAALWQRFPGPARSSRAAAVALVALVSLVGLVETVNRGLNTAFEASTRAEVEISAQFMDEVPPNITVMSFSHAPHTIGVRRTLDPSGPRFGYIDSYPCLSDLARCALDREPDYIYVTHQGMKLIALQHGRSVAHVQGELGRMLASGRYVVNTDSDAVLILRRPDVAELPLTSADRFRTGRSLK